MNATEINIALNEFCGGKWLYNPTAETPHRFLLGPDTSVSHAHQFEEAPDNIPIMEEFLEHGLNDYAGDLNQLQQAERLLTRDQWLEWARLMYELLDKPAISTMSLEGYSIDTVISWLKIGVGERAEVLVKVIGKWKKTT